MIAECFSFHHLHRVNNSFQSIGKERVLAMVKNLIGIFFEHISRSHHWFQMVFIRELTQCFQVFLNLGAILPEFFQKICENGNQRQVLIHFQRPIHLVSFLGKQILLVLQEQVCASLDYLFPFLSGFVVFLPSYTIDNFPKGLYPMKLIKDNQGFWTAFPGRFDRGIPDIDHYWFNQVFSLLTQRVKKGFQGFILTPFPGKDNMDSLPIEGQSEIMIIFIDHRFTDREKTGITYYSWCELSSEIGFINGFHCLPIQTKMFRCFFEGYHRTEKKQVLIQYCGNSFTGMNQVRFFILIPASWASFRLISRGQSGLRIKTIEISYHPFMIGMSFFHFVLTVVTGWIIRLSGLMVMVTSFFLLIIGLFLLPSLNKNQKNISCIWDVALLPQDCFYCCKILYPEN